MKYFCNDIFIECSNIPDNIEFDIRGRQDLL